MRLPTPVGAIRFPALAPFRGTLDDRDARRAKYPPRKATGFPVPPLERHRSDSRAGRSGAGGDVDRGGQDGCSRDCTLTCRDCGELFRSAGEQQFFATKGLVNDPQRCASCRSAAKHARAPPARPPGPASTTRPSATPAAARRSCRSRRATTDPVLLLHLLRQGARGVRRRRLSRTGRRSPLGQSSRRRSFSSATKRSRDASSTTCVLACCCVPGVVHHGRATRELAAGLDDHVAERHVRRDRRIEGDGHRDRIRQVEARELGPRTP